MDALIGILADFACRRKVERALRHEPITIYGDGRQLRDLLYVEDLVDALLRASTNDGVLKGRAFNSGDTATSQPVCIAASPGNRMSPAVISSRTLVAGRCGC